MEGLVAKDFCNGLFPNTAEKWETEKQICYTLPFLLLSYFGSGRDHIMIIQYTFYCSADAAWYDRCLRKPVQMQNTCAFWNLIYNKTYISHQ